MYVLVYFLCFSYVTHHENIFYVVTRTTMLPSGLYYLFLRSLFLISAFSSELRLPEHIFCGDYLILTFLFICFHGGKKKLGFCISFTSGVPGTNYHYSQPTVGLSFSINFRIAIFVHCPRV